MMTLILPLPSYHKVDFATSYTYFEQYSCVFIGNKSCEMSILPAKSVPRCLVSLILETTLLKLCPLTWAGFIGEVNELSRRLGRLIDSVKFVTKY